MVEKAYFWNGTFVGRGGSYLSSFVVGGKITTKMYDPTMDRPKYETDITLQYTGAYKLGYVEKTKCSIEKETDMILKLTANQIITFSPDKISSTVVSGKYTSERPTDSGIFELRKTSDC